VRTRTEQNCSAGQCPVPFPENAQCLVQWFELHWSGEKYMNDGMTLKCCNDGCLATGEGTT